MDQESLLEFAAFTQEKLAEWKQRLAELSDPINQQLVEDSVRVYEILASHVAAGADEAKLRSGIAELRMAMSMGMDAGAFMTAQYAIDMVHALLGDEAIDTGLVPRTLEEAAHFLARAIEPAAMGRFRAEIVEGRGQTLRESFHLGMSVRNTLRTAGFTETALGVADLDDVWYPLLERAALAQGTT